MRKHLAGSTSVHGFSEHLSKTIALRKVSGTRRPPAPRTEGTTNRHPTFHRTTLFGRRVFRSMGLLIVLSQTSAAPRAETRGQFFGLSMPVRQDAVDRVAFTSHASNSQGWTPFSFHANWIARHLQKHSRRVPRMRFLNQTAASVCRATQTSAAARVQNSEQLISRAFNSQGWTSPRL